jgi:hypothetical protein
MGTYTNLIQQKEQSSSEEGKQTPAPAPVASAKPPKTPVRYPNTQKTTQISKSLSNFLSNSLSTDEIEKLNFQLRKIPKVRVNADIPPDWKDQLDDLAHALRVGKYELLLYMIALLLGKVEKQE